MLHDPKSTLAGLEIGSPEAARRITGGVGFGGPGAGMGLADKPAFHAILRPWRPSDRPRGESLREMFSRDFHTDQKAPPADEKPPSHPGVVVGLYRDRTLAEHVLKSLEDAAPGTCFSLQSVTLNG